MPVLSPALTGWAGAPGQSEYSLKFDLLDAYVIQGLLISGLYNYGQMSSISITHQLHESYSESYILNPIAIAYSTATRLAWIDINVPFVARYLTIKLETWEGDLPAGSMEIIGYRYTPDLWEDTQYLGMRGQLQNESSITRTIVSSDIDFCLDTCRSEGYHYMRLKEVSGGIDTCACLTPSSSIRDFYTDEPDGRLCLDSRQCSAANSTFTALYSTHRLKCESLSWINAQAVLSSIVSSNFSSVTVGTTFNVTCNQGYSSDQWEGTFTTFCTNYRVWYPSPVDFTCDVLDCGYPPHLANLTLAPHNGDQTTIYQATVSYQCEASGHLLNGTELTFDVTCSASGQWLPKEYPPCIPVVCIPPSPGNASYLVPKEGGVYVYGDTAVIKCDAGKVFEGMYSDTQTLQCQSNGTWSDEPNAACISLVCPAQLPPVSHAHGSLQSASSGVYECNGGRRFSDQETTKTVMCDHQTNQWPPAHDACSKTKRFGTTICLVQEDKCMDTSMLAVVLTRSLVDCALTCSDTPFCRSVCYRRAFKMGDPDANCCLLSSEWDYEQEKSLVGWDFYDTFGTNCP
ncbi:sushi/von Willebrand factor type a/egf/pentraxin domain-containing 1 [Plakobranchus ocellatus]|uniref:Sushi/von Willebrand factor type a/egf/pentraxin domain-containing 1 n=1 Tax=Plakobranchus ocellatus TaxID=259542 RepID=A0AAV3Z549_9GAST|nr:sushi/von Willebrand factor type a/egf/pentraxin domain-containing 1 [Plakobranchus ocellatus]